MTKFVKDTRVQYQGIGMPRFNGKNGVVTKHTTHTGYVLVRFDGENTDYTVDPNNLLLESEALNPKDQAVKVIGEALAAEKKAKQALAKAIKEAAALGIDKTGYVGESYTLSLVKGVLKVGRV